VAPSFLHVLIFFTILDPDPFPVLEDSGLYSVFASATTSSGLTISTPFAPPLTMPPSGYQEGKSIYIVYADLL